MNNTEKLLRAFIEAQGYEIETLLDYEERDMTEVEAMAHNKGFGCATGYRLLTETNSQKLLIDDNGNYKGVLIEPIVDYKVTKDDVDYRELLVKYISLVGSCEGVSFISECDDDFTQEEIKALRVCEKDG